MVEHKKSPGHLLALAYLGLVVLATLAAYSDSFGVPFVIDDVPSIARNTSIRGLPHLSEWWSPPAASTVSGRPILNASFAINYCISGYEVWSYHLFNLAIHFGCGALIFLIVCSTLRRIHGAAGPDPILTAAIASGLWLVHPLQTEAVTYLVQRAESLSTLFYLASFYGFIRYIDGRPWGAVASIVLLIAGVLTKEIVATAPVLFLLYDYAFVTGSVKRAVEKHWRYYACSLSSWIAIAATVLVTRGRNGTVAFGTEIGPLDYALTETWAILRYLELAVLPVGQIFPYEAASVTSMGVIAPCLVAVATLLAFSVYLVVRRPRIGFLLCGFFIILAPTSSFIPIVTETVAEHRMYLPLGICTTIAALLLIRLPLWATGAVSTTILIFLAGATFARNRVYASPMSILADAESKQPNAADFANYYALELVGAGDLRDAEAMLRHSISVHPTTQLPWRIWRTFFGREGRLPRRTACTPWPWLRSPPRRRVFSTSASPCERRATCRMRKLPCGGQLASNPIFRKP